MLVIDRYFVAARNFLLEWIALNGEDAGQSQTHSAAMTHGMARIRLGRLERVLVAFRASAGVIICLSSGRENRHHSRT